MVRCDVVVGDSEEPGTERTSVAGAQVSPLEPVDRTQGLEEDFFREVLGISFVPDASEAVAVQAGDVCVVQQPRGLLIPVRTTPHVIALVGNSERVGCLSHQAVSFRVRPSVPCLPQPMWRCGR